MSTTIIGIDNGFDGGIAHIYADGRAIATVMPTLNFTAAPRKGKKHDRTVREYDEGAINELLLGFDNTNSFAFIEHAQAQSRYDPQLKRHVPQGSVTNFNTGFGFGLLRGMLAARMIPYQIVRPQAWQKVMFDGMTNTADTKTLSAIVAGRLFPDLDLRKSERCRTPHDGKTDALLIAEYGRRLRS